MGNRLEAERSPYLQQHAQNPVDWYPWGDEALSRARDEDLPIMLSIGYSACHWCHVMEHESFDDPATAEVLSEGFVCIKVDREERPDLDSIYMKAVQSMTGRGGWPLTAFLTPDGRPFYGGTYYPPEPRHGMPSFRQVLAAVRDAWTLRRDEVEAGANRLRDAVEVGMAGGAPDGAESAARRSTDWAALLDRAVAQLRRSFDPVHGGFGGAPKFPQPVTLEFLLGRWQTQADPVLLDHVAHTLRSMRDGGIHDQLAGGFHRYSVDAQWRVPHFEKMLYDNALLARVYLQTARATGLNEFVETARRTLDWMRADLGAAEGGFHSAWDADSEGEEGRYYVWTPDEVHAVAAAAGVEPALTRLFCEVHDVSEGGNFEGRNILHLGHVNAGAAGRSGFEPERIERAFEQLRVALLEQRARREPPLCDTKILCSWNAFAVRAFAEAGHELDDEPYRDVARRTAEFLLGQLWVDGRLYHVHSHGAPRIEGFLEDWAALGNALLTLHETTGEVRWIAPARACVDAILDRFHDPATGRLYDTPCDAEPLVVRPRDLPDSATPSGHSLAVELLLRGGDVLERPQGRAVAERALGDQRDLMVRHPEAFGRLLRQAERLAT